MESKSHWDEVYSTKSSETVSWYQPHATLPLEMIRAVAQDKSVRIVDVGGGASSLVDDLLAHGMSNVGVLDISGAALAVARHRLGEKQAAKVRWMEGDITTIPLAKASIDIWHDRAVFHFLTNPADRAAYVSQVRHALRPGGHVIVAAFARDGPLECSGLPVMRYAPDALHAQFGGAFELLEHMQEEHHTPSGLVQHFVYCHCVMH